MEVFTGDHGLQTDVIISPDTHLSPFSLPTADHQKILTDHHHFLPPPQPPQKLRPIRCNGRAFSDCCSSDDPKPLSWTEDAGFHNPETDAGAFIPPNPSTLGLSSEKCQNEPAFSSSSDEINKSEEPVNKKKRKRKSRKKLESLIENMMKTVIENQEQMYRQLIETLEKKEQESIMREQAWRQQEAERAKQNEQARKQEASRNLALISFIQNTLGQEIQIPNPIPVDDAPNQIDNQIEENIICEESERGDLSIKKWSKSEVQALITVRTAINHKFTSKGAKGSIWEEVANGLSSMGYDRTPKRCKEKWENINKYYRRTMDKDSAHKSKVCTYFRELEMLYKTGFISTNSNDDDQTVNNILN